MCAALSCLLEHFGVGDSMKVEDRPRVILTAEEELGITAGLQDRVAQVYGGLVYMVCLVLFPIPPALLQAYKISSFGLSIFWSSQKIYNQSS